MFSMFDWIPNLKTEPCPVVDWKLGFLTPKEDLVANTAKELADWINDWFNAIDFSFPKNLNIDCATAREILMRAWIMRTWKLQ